MGRRTAAGRGTHRLSERRSKRGGGLDGHVPRAAPRLDGQARPRRVQADARLGRLLARRPEECAAFAHLRHRRSEEHTSELQSLMRISYAVFCLKKKTKQIERMCRKNDDHISKINYR